MNLELAVVCSECANWQHNSSKASGCEPFHFLISTHETLGMAEQHQSHPAKKSDLTVFADRTEQKERIIFLSITSFSIFGILVGIAGIFDLCNDDFENHWLAFRD